MSTIPINFFSATKRCKLYEDGQVITLDGSIVNDTGNNVVATVHKWRYGRNNDPCKFYVKVHRDENYLVNMNTFLYVFCSMAMMIKY